MERGCVWGSVIVLLDGGWGFVEHVDVKVLVFEVTGVCVYTVRSGGGWYSVMCV